MKIDKPGNRDRFSKDKRVGEKVPTKRSAFLEVLEHQPVNQELLEVALEGVLESARKLRESPTFPHLRKYKAAVRAFLNQVLRQLYAVDQRTFVDRRGHRRVYLLVEQVDESLEALTRSFLAGQVAALDVAKRLDEIRGMLMDLYT